MVEKYIGDAIFAVFGLQNAVLDYAANALCCADWMIAELDSWNNERSRAGEPPLAIGIGLNYGPAGDGYLRL
jgi:adenylate cyclase